MESEVHEHTEWRRLGCGNSTTQGSRLFGVLVYQPATHQRTYTTQMRVADTPKTASVITDQTATAGPGTSCTPPVTRQARAACTGLRQCITPTGVYHAHACSGRTQNCISYQA